MLCLSLYLCACLPVSQSISIYSTLYLLSLSPSFSLRLVLPNKTKKHVQQGTTARLEMTFFLSYSFLLFTVFTSSRPASSSLSLHSLSHPSSFPLYLFFHSVFTIFLSPFSFILLPFFLLFLFSHLPFFLPSFFIFTFP